MFRFLPLSLLLLTACGAPEPLYMIDTPQDLVEGKLRLQVATLEIREVSLPAYAEESQILLESGDGALSPIKDALWADEPTRAATLLLADRIAARSRSTVAAEPWPLETPAQAAVHVQVSQMVARAAGRLDLKGQFAVSSYDHVIRERIVRFDISAPLAESSPGGIAKASGEALKQLADQIVQELAR
ncbi:PqiC family protein [Celeribacter neptunius]|uniref:ABC-type transport auxiliary lipoprotein component domain-containing protein n=1 Tax=Celeribacter neptunius TaxID=588602 RepID=A0A1I3QY68_9RHOB|nr:PqiC family protein [Celeribacter neptunius]SFJ38845.1 hypothetical protein SAMN04487991_2006 [Celeribacter neptunius]